MGPRQLRLDVFVEAKQDVNGQARDGRAFVMRRKMRGLPRDSTWLHAGRRPLGNAGATMSFIGGVEMDACQTMSLQFCYKGCQWFSTLPLPPWPEESRHIPWVVLCFPHHRELTDWAY